MMGKTGYSKDELNARYYQGFADGVKEIEAKYRDLEEQGLLLRLPCKVGDTVYAIGFNNNKPIIYESVVLNILITEKEIVFNVKVDEFEVNSQLKQSMFGKTVFLTQAEAEQKLKEMESEDADNLIKLTQKDMEFAFNNGFLDMTFEREHLIKVIRNQPTAYDLDKTVKELKELRDRYDDSIKNFAIRGIIDETIEIVKQSGVSDDVCEWKKSGDTAINPHTSSKFKIKQCDGLYALNTCPYCSKKIKVVE